jgi:RNA polymerase sigma factor (sigma-70 family)
MTDSTHPASTLLQHAEFLQRLAVQLAGSDHADDLAQDTWMATMARPPRRGDNPRGWLATIAANLWRNHRRAAGRRAARERLRAAPAAVPGVDEIVAREEVRRRVVAAVVALPEPLREVVLLRFYEGLESPVIGVRLGRPASTVRTQLQTALERLRKQLDSEHDGNRAAWALPLAGWRRFLHGPVTAPPVATALLLLRAAAALLLLLGGAALWWQLRASPDAPPRAAARLAQDVAAATPRAPE